MCCVLKGWRPQNPVRSVLQDTDQTRQHIGVDLFETSQPVVQRVHRTRTMLTVLEMIELPEPLLYRFECLEMSAQVWLHPPGASPRLDSLDLVQQALANLTDVVIIQVGECVEQSRTPGLFSHSEPRALPKGNLRVLDDPKKWLVPREVFELSHLLLDREALPVSLGAVGQVDARLSCNFSERLLEIGDRPIDFCSSSQRLAKG